ncbi:ABC transporter permease [Microbacterium ulmi]|uniref:ABC transporter permease n=1 Tax=Microbacterium ulmi TaxID=179095 RepID=A0A7Y2Q0S3_9MICO|nr:ABC transporter permease [Microbacterium ulmi]NII69841.1 peptide/nickel transport system permease protein [Microbacterium ulmi]NNH03190.1 ABC transporter permease [Microbacterium ulmi]
MTSAKTARAFRRLSRGLVFKIAVVALAAVVFSAVFVQAIMPFDPYLSNVAARNLPPLTPSDTWLPYLLGTDPLGRDLLTRIMLGGRVSLMVGVASVLVSGTIGVTMGLLAGYFRGWADQVIMRLVDIQMSIPSLLIALLVLYVLGPSMLNVIFVLAITRWMVYARVTRSLVLSLRTELFVEASRSLGASHLRTLAQHIVPNLAGPVMILATLEVAVVLLSEASLSFLGLGIQPPDTSWGLLLAQGSEYITAAWWLVAFPGLAILVTTLSINLIASSIRARSGRDDIGWEDLELAPDLDGAVRR